LVRLFLTSVMKARTRLLHPVILLILIIVVAGFHSASTSATGVQDVPEPRRDELLNGLRVILLPQPGNANVIIRLRINSGAAFDLDGKAGGMALLGDNLFPDPETRDFFTEELGGSLDIATDYDGINVRMAGRASEFERMIELLRTAVASSPITNENVVRLRDSRIKMIREMSVAPAFVADRAIAKRLFGNYPYGKPVAGSTESLARVERADLLLARDRFLSPDNATLVIVGGIDERRAFRALRQLLGAWRRSDKRVPATFRQPDAVDTRTLIVDAPDADSVEIRLAARTVPRADKDYVTASLLALLARDRWQAAFPDLNKSPFFVRNQSNLLAGMFVMGASVKTDSATAALDSARKVLRSLAEGQPTVSELERVRSEAIAIVTREAGESPMIAEFWLDVESYKLDSKADRNKALAKITPADIQRVAAQMFRDSDLASVALGNSTELKALFERSGKVELLGETAAPKTPEATQPSKNP
jgi:zinc protease